MGELSVGEQSGHDKKKTTNLHQYLPQQQGHHGNGSVVDVRANPKLVVIIITTNTSV